MDLQDSRAATFQLCIYSQECILVGGFHPESWSCCLKKIILVFFILPSFIIDVFHSSHNFSLGTWGKVLTAVQPRLRPWVLTLFPVDQRRSTISYPPTWLCWAGLEWSPRTSLILVLCFCRAPRWTCVKLLCNKVIWGRIKYTKPDQYSSEWTTEKTPPFPQVNTQPQMWGLLVRVKYCQGLLPVFFMHQ